MFVQQVLFFMVVAKTLQIDGLPLSRPSDLDDEAFFAIPAIPAIVTPIPREVFEEKRRYRKIINTTFRLRSFANQKLVYMALNKVVITFFMKVSSMALFICVILLFGLS